MQIQLMITEEFGDVVSFAEFAQALQQFLAGRAHRVQIGKTDASPKAVEAVKRAPVMVEPAPAPTPADVFGDMDDALPAASVASGDPLPAVEAPQKAKRGRPVKVKADVAPAADEPPLPLVEAPAATAADPFADIAVAAPPKAPTYDQIRPRVLHFMELRPDRAAAASEWSKAPTYDQIRPRVLHFMELRPDRAAAASEWSKALRESGYASVADITNDRPGETAEAKCERVNKIVTVLEEMIAKAEAAKASAGK